MTSAQNHRRPLNGNKYLRSIFLCLLALVLIACGDKEKQTGTSSNAVSPTAAAITQPQLRVRVTVASVFAWPDRKSEIITNLVEGETLPVAGKSEPDELGTIFYMVRIGERAGWIAAAQIELLGDAAAVQVVEVVSPQASSTPEMPVTEMAAGVTLTVIGPVRARVVVLQASIYDLPGDTGARISTAVSGDEFIVISQTPMSEGGVIFYGVQLRNRLGWVRGDAVEIRGDTSRLYTVFTSTPTPTITATQIIATPTVTPFQAVTALPTNTPDTNGVAGQVTVTPQPTEGTATPASTLPATTPTPPSVRRTDPPPFVMTLPAGWDQGHVLVPIVSAISSATDVRLSIYEGPLPDGLTGHIWVVWGFPNILPPSQQEITLWPDAILYLRELLFNGCNIGIDLEGRTTYLIDRLQAVGTTYQAVDCGGGLADVGGRFMAIRVDDVNYSFYLGVEPIGSMLEGLVALQNIVNTIRFTPQPQ